MNTQKGFSTLLGLLLVFAVAGGGAYWYAHDSKSEIGTETAMEEKPATDDAEKVSEKTNTAQTVSEAPVIASVTGTYANQYVSLNERVIITGKNFTSEKNLSVYLRPSMNHAGEKYNLPIEQSSDTSITVVIPDGIDDNRFGGYDLVVENSNGLASDPTDVILRPSNAAGEDVEIALWHILPSYRIGDTVTLKYKLSDSFKDYPVLVDLRHVVSGEVFKYGYTKGGLPYEYIDKETMSFDLKNYPDDGVQIKRGEYQLCIWLSTKNSVQDCTHNTITIE